jgi:phosphonate transport system substrate-binding protein
MWRPVSFVVAAAVAALLACGLLFLVFFEDISTSPAPLPRAASPARAPKPVVHVGVISRYTPTTIYQGYQPIMDYLTEATPYRFELKLGRTYWETVELLSGGRVAVAFLGRKVYLQARERHALTAILKPLNDDFRPVFQDAVIARSGSEIRTLENLVGRSVALPSQDSYSGIWLKAEGYAVGQARFPLARVQHFEHHHTVVYQVLRGNFEAGVVRESVAEEYEGKGISIVARAQPVPGSPIVVARRHDPDVVAAFTKALLAVDPRKSEFTARLASWDVEFRNGFARAEDRDYDGLKRVLTGTQGPD